MQTASFQPLITSAFATYTVRKPTYIEQRSATSDPQDVAGLGAAGVVSTDRVPAVQQVEKTQGAERVLGDNKPRSASGDVLDLSSDYQNAYNQKTESSAESRETEHNAEARTTDNEAVATPEEETVQTAEESSALTPEEQEQVEKLKARDAEVRIHEQTHLAMAGPYATGGPTYTYQTGPDGKRYAIGGEVGIDTSEVSGAPEATIQKMQRIAAAALAPVEPSTQDQKVAAAARLKEAQARAELAKQNTDSLNSSTETEETGNVSSTVQTADDVTEAANSSAQKSGNSMSAAAYRSQSTVGNNRAGVLPASFSNSLGFSAFA